MKNKKKTLLMSLGAMLLVVATVMGTMAFLTSTTKTVTNKFTTAGNVEITLDESEVTEYGVVKDSANRITGNNYKLIPGQTYTKDPIVHVLGGSESSHVYVRVQNGLADLLKANTEEIQTIAEQMQKNKWVLVQGYKDLYRYESLVDASNPKLDEDLPVFERFTLKSDIDYSIHTDKEIIITAYAIQSLNVDVDTANAAALEILGGTQ